MTLASIEVMRTISLGRLALAFVPVLAVIFVLWRWRLDYMGALYGLGRMLVQLLLVGYVLVFLFARESAPVVLAVLLVMIVASTWIALRDSPVPASKLFGRALMAVAIGGGLPLAVSLFAVLDLQPWYAPMRAIPLAGMSFAAAMTSVSLANERLGAELARGAEFGAARKVALHAALIPITNSLFAVGLVSLPGMMTGQILSGVDPFIAARYQIMVMCMIFAASGLSAALLLRSRMVEP